MTELLNLIKDLREITGAGFLDCKKALLENNNNVENSITYLRKKGLSKANKKSSRQANEGVVCVNIKDNKGSIIEINTETDFAAKNQEFLKFAKELNSISILSNNLEDLFNRTDSNNIQVSELLTNMISKIGENIIIKRFEKITCNDKDKIFSYVHNKYDDNIGKIASMISVKSHLFNDELIDLCRKICMHITALKPISLNIKDLNADLIKKEKEIIIENIKSSGKPDNIINNIVDGKLKKYYEEVVLMEQKFIIDNETKIKDLFIEFNKKYKVKPEIIDYKLFVLAK